MSSLRDSDKQYLEHILEMGGGYVLDYTNDTFAALFRRHGVDIDDPKYWSYGQSKAKRLRSFWELEPDQLVGRILAEMLESYETGRELTGKSIDVRILTKARAFLCAFWTVPRQGIGRTSWRKNS